MVRLMDRASRQIAFALAEQKPNLPGVSVVTEMQRRYPQNDLAAHVLGFLGQVSVSEKGGGYRPNVLVGKMGLEKNYDKVLRGVDGGMRFEVDASGRSLKILDRQEPSVGYEVRTTLDFKIQKAAEEALKESGKAGAIVALDPKNGDVLALASAPQFDPNAFVYVRGEENGEDFQVSSLLIDPQKPLFNRAVQGRYPPGSIFKVITLAAAVESQKINPRETIDCPGYYRLEGRVPKTFLCWKKDGHKKLNLLESTVNSCNVYFYSLGLKLGSDAIERLAGQFGLGAKTGIEIKGEEGGMIPGRSRFKTHKRNWYDGDTLNMAIGQGTILLTPLQAAQIAGTVASRGKVYRPHLIKDIRTPTGEIFSRSKIELAHSVSLSDETWNFVNQAMTQSVERGTGQSCKIPGISVGGKTGTAQNPQGKDHAWFVAFAPVHDPAIALSVLVEHGIQGSAAAAPIARKVLLAALDSAGKE
jgi:penicillin-binding protein 2